MPFKVLKQFFIITSPSSQIALSSSFAILSGKIVFVTIEASNKANFYALTKNTVPLVQICSLKHSKLARVFKTYTKEIFCQKRPSSK